MLTLSHNEANVVWCPYHQGGEERRRAKEGGLGGTVAEAVT